MSTAVTPGENVLAYCKGCKKVSEHSVVAVRASRPYRVQCITCEDAHPYRAGPPVSKKKSASALKSRSLASDFNYDNLMVGRDPSMATTYAMSQQFASAELITHATFGVGLVTRVLVNHKIEVIFPEGIRMLAHER